MPVYKDSNAQSNPWYYAFEIKDSQGKRKTIKKRGFRTKKLAEAAEIAVKDSMNKGTYVKPSKMTFGDYLQNWLDNRRDIKDRTKYYYKGLINLHIVPLIGQILLADLNALVIENFLSAIETKGMSESSNKNIFKVINKSLSDAERKQIILRNPAALVSKPKVSKKEMGYWTPEEAREFLKSIDNHRLKIIFVLAIHCGMRMSEILGLRFTDIDLEKRKIHIRHILTFKRELQVGTKTSAGNRSITISHLVAEEIKKRKAIINKERTATGDRYEDKEFLVCSKSGNPISKANCDCLWKRLLKNNNIRRIRFHDLRHTCASLLFSIDVHPKIVQELLGHSSIKVTLDLYSHMMPNMHGEAASALEKLLM